MKHSEGWEHGCGRPFESVGSQTRGWYICSACLDRHRRLLEAARACTTPEAGGGLLAWMGEPIIELVKAVKEFDE